MREHINTVSGPVRADELGWTLFHEHATVGMPGWESDTLALRTPFDEVVKKAVARIEDMKAAGFSTFVDPVPNDLARNVDLLKAIADSTGFNIVFATGLYSEHAGGSVYWRTALATRGPDGGKRVTDLFVNEIENGVGSSGLKPGVIKVAIGHGTDGVINPYEEQIVRAAGRASALTGTPILTHTEGKMGVELLALIEDEGGQVGNVVVGHSDDSADPSYHDSVLKAGSYIGFDRFGYEYAVKDVQRIENILALRERGQLDQLLISTDSVWHWQGEAFTPAMFEGTLNNLKNGFGHVPQLLRDAGLSETELETIYATNTRRFLTGESAS